MHPIQEKLHRLYFSKAYKRTFFSVITLLLLIMLAISLFFYHNFLARQKDDLYARVQEAVAGVEQQMTENMRQMMHIVLAVNSNNIFTYTPLDNTKQRDEIQTELSRYVSDNAFLIDMSYLSLLADGTVYSSQGIYASELFSKYIYRYADSFDIDTFEKRRNSMIFATVPAGQMVSLQTPVSVMAFEYGLPLFSTAPKRFITFYISKNTIDEIVDRLLPFETNEINFYEQDALVYSRYGVEAPENDVRITYHSQTTPYTYELLISPAALYADYDANMLFFITMLCVSVLVILISGSMVAFYNYSPLYRLVSKFSQNNPGATDEIALLNDLVEDGIAQKNRVQLNLFITNLVWGQYETAAELEIATQEAGVSFSFPLFTCCSIAYGDANPQEALVEALDTPNSMALCAKRQGQNRLTLIINHTNAEDGALAIEASLQGLSGVSVGRSTIGKEESAIPELHTQARHAVHYALENRLALVDYADIPAQEEVIPQPAPENTNGNLQARILSFMQENLNDTGMSLESIATTCGISTSYLVRYFKSCMGGVTPMQYVDALRMGIAKRMLTTTNSCLRKIVEACGYLDESNFARKFKKQEGITPMNYRRTHWKETTSDEVQTGEDSTSL